MARLTYVNDFVTYLVLTYVKSRLTCAACFKLNHVPLTRGGSSVPQTYGTHSRGARGRARTDATAHHGRLWPRFWTLSASTARCASNAPPHTVLRPSVPPHAASAYRPLQHMHHATTQPQPRARNATAARHGRLCGRSRRLSISAARGASDAPQSVERRPSGQPLAASARRATAAHERSMRPAGAAARATPPPPTTAASEGDPGGYRYLRIAARLMRRHTPCRNHRSRRQPLPRVGPPQHMRRPQLQPRAERRRRPPRPSLRAIRGSIRISDSSCVERAAD